MINLKLIHWLCHAHTDAWLTAGTVELRIPPSVGMRTRLTIQGRSDRRAKGDRKKRSTIAAE
jgi:hypothetical protein